MKSVKNRVLLVFIILISAVGIYKSVFYGYDSDESYNATLILRSISGDHLFKEMWELHQTSAFLSGPLVAVYKWIVGSTAGIMIYLRIAGLLLHTFICIGFFNALRKWIPEEYALLFAGIFYNYAPKFIVIPEYSFLLYLFITALIACVLEYMYRPRKIMAVGIGVFLAGSVLVYPLIIFVIPVLLIGLWYVLKNSESDAKRNRGFITVLITDVILGTLFLIFVLKNISIKELPAGIEYVMSDGSHDLPWIERITQFIGSCIDNYKIILVLTILVEVIRRYLLKSGKDKALKILKASYLGCAMLIPLFQAAKVYSSWGFIYLYSSYWVMVLMWAFVYLNAVKKEKKALFPKSMYVLSIGLVLAFLAAHFGSNLDYHVNAGLLLPILLILSGAYVYKDEEAKTKGTFIIFLILMISFGVLRIVCIRGAGGDRYTIFSDFKTVECGSLKGSKVPYEEALSFERKINKLEELVSNDDIIMYIGEDKYLYNSLDSKYGISSTISTPTFDELLLEYYDKYPYKVPGIIIAEPYMIDGEVIHNMPFKEWFRANYERIYEDELIYVYKKTVY